MLPSSTGIYRLLANGRIHSKMASSKFNERELERYRRIFTMYDLNGDGAISVKELKKVSRQMGYRLDEGLFDVSHFPQLSSIFFLISVR